jgi:hypothetical protein
MNAADLRSVSRKAALYVLRDMELLLGCQQLRNQRLYPHNHRAIPEARGEKPVVLDFLVNRIALLTHGASHAGIVEAAFKREAAGRLYGYMNVIKARGTLSTAPFHLSGSRRPDVSGRLRSDLRQLGEPRSTMERRGSP